MSFSGRKILFIGIGFYDYENAIVNRMIERGCDVTAFIDKPYFLRQRPWGGLFYRIPNAAQYLQKWHEEKILNHVKKEKYEQVLIIKGTDYSNDFIRNLRNILSNSEFILYEWDSITRYPQLIERLDYFDKVLSFDRHDALKFPSIKFRPLFYRVKEELSNSNDNTYKYDIIFIGLLQSSRLEQIREIQAQSAANDLKTYTYLITGFPHWIKLWLKGQSRDIHFRKLSYDKVLKLNMQSLCVLDLPHPDQTGLTMRSIETLGLDRKLITTGKDVIYYDFFNDEKISIIDQDQPKIDITFIKENKDTVSFGSVKNNYSLDKWLDDVLGE
ncbi:MULTISPECIES: hypothetical protein [unclassified Brenneria]|uniref:hypothetical protein n=1 Tax=unclassified Brenneria TaxID=2634434 RepID=UPI0015571259|nr:hypothetical protein [Brenneria sp. hezel4-2-4]MEE3650977.1 hypothetical protein [Brenneria sp. HEZEL_4_2_4]NPD00932.1 hypothetical protein [Brenneria sp. hezel4-2-4]